MKRMLILINGLKLPYYMIEYSLAQAIQHGASVHALFIKAKTEKSEGYGWPSDLRATEEKTEIEDGIKDDLSIIHDSIKLVVDMAASENVSCTTEIISDCSLEQLLKIVRNYDILFVDGADEDNNTSMIRNSQFSLKELLEQSPTEIKLVYDEDRQ